MLINQINILASSLKISEENLKKINFIIYRFLIINKNIEEICFFDLRFFYEYRENSLIIRNKDENNR